MSVLELTEKERIVLVDALESYLSDLKTERSKTDNREWRADLREQEAILNGLLGHLIAKAA
ncbi:hypothetical protein F6V30_06170 [Oryzomonas sagensis]|uniref:Uncharacterized protein n=1 Tax=Oryzomonas sagensis TaxID=2603857 RepID=A0ABQ6TT09_9BACT|nr:hypothetical protein [Oryzomonas sagensis]KAB0672150.1 hypothetical protein F6V30_06170 [Oryzomonas sagensis]